MKESKSLSKNGHIDYELLESFMGRDLNEIYAELQGEREADVLIGLDHFRAYAPENKFIHEPTGELWSAGAVDDRIPAIATGQFKKNGQEITIPASKHLAQTRSVEQMTWHPDLPRLIENRIVLDGGIVEVPGLTTYNLYRAPNLDHGDPEKAGLWLDLVKKIYPDDHDHIVNWLASKVQRPGVKINHALVLGGAPGIGKDTVIEPVVHAAGHWNCSETSPAIMLGRFNGHLQSVILRISEARDMGNVNRYGFYETLKNVIAAPPDTLRIDKKNMKEYAIVNVVGVIMTTNHKAGGMYLPANDRRHYVAWSDCTQDDFDKAHWDEIWQWYERGGFEHVAAYLQSHNLDNFNPKTPPPKTDAFWEIVDAGRAPEDSELAEALDKLDNPDAVTIDMVAEEASIDFAGWLSDRRNRRQIPHRFETAGYVPIRNDASKRGIWKLNGKGFVIYAKRDLTKRERLVAARTLLREGDLS